MAASIRQRAKSVSKKISTSYWELGKLLNEIYEESLHSNWGYGSFKYYVEGELGVTLRMSQYCIRLHKWQAKLNPAARKWAHSERFFVLRTICSAVSDSNWEEWRDLIIDRTQSEVVALFRAWRTGDEKAKISETLLAKAKRKMPDDTLGQMIYLRSLGLKAGTVAGILGVKEVDVKKLTRFVSCFIPRELYEHIEADALDAGRTVSLEITDILMAVYSNRSKKQKVA